MVLLKTDTGTTHNANNHTPTHTQVRTGRKGNPIDFHSLCSKVIIIPVHVLKRKLSIKLKRIQCHNVLNILVQFAVVSFIFVYSSSQRNHIKGYSPVSMYNRKVALFHHNIHPYPHSRAHILILILIHIHNRIRIRIHKTMI